MSKADDLLGKADAFLKRYHPASTAAQGDVPVLTEVIAEAAAVPAKTAPPAVAEASTARTDLVELEQKLRQSILDAVASQVAKTVEEPLKTHLDAHLERALATLNAQIKADLETFIRETVARAVASEIARIRGPSRGA